MPIDIQSKLIAIPATRKATIGLLRRRSRERNFVVLQEATTSIFFSVVSQGREGLIAIRKLSIARSNDNKDCVFLCCIAMSKQQWYNVYIILRGSERWPCGIARERASVHRIARANKDNIQPLQGCKVQLQLYGDDGPPRASKRLLATLPYMPARRLR